jgi:8-amino-7-oxononanoate synthase
VIVGDTQRALAISQKLEEKGFLISEMRPPTVPAGTARLRVTLSAAHEEREVDALVAAFQEALAA